MFVTTEITSDNIYDELWSGGRDTIDDLSDDQIDTVLDILESEGSEYTITELNDFFWFERDTIAEWLGFKDYDTLLKGFDPEDLKKENDYYFNFLHSVNKKYNATTKPLKITYFEYSVAAEQFV